MQNIKIRTKQNQTIMNQLNEYTSPEMGESLDDALKAAGYDIKPSTRWTENKTAVGVAQWKELYYTHHTTSLFWDDMTPAFSFGQLFNLLCSGFLRHRMLGEHYGQSVEKINLTYDGILFKYKNDFGVTVCPITFIGTKPNNLAALIMWCIENNYPINATKANKNTPS